MACWAPCCRWPRREMEAAHGVVPGAGFAVIGYGSLGGRELGFGSDLDLVFLHDARGDEVSDGARPLEAPRYFARLAQKLVALLGTVTAAGRLYEVDVRLRPDGAKGVLVSSLQSFSRLPAGPRLDLGTAGAGARARGGRRSDAVRADSSRFAARCCTPRTGSAGAAGGRDRDAPAHARRTRSQRRRFASTSSRARADWSIWNS